MESKYKRRSRRQSRLDDSGISTFEWLLIDLFDGLVRLLNELFPLYLLVLCGIILYSILFM